MRVVKVLLGVLLLLAVVFVGVGKFALPDSVHVEREIVIQRPPAQVFAVLNGFARFNEWSPWLRHDPQQKTRIAGPASGIGAEMHWTSDKIGNGSQQITEVETDRLIVVALMFDQNKATARYALAPVGEDGTRVVWSLDMNAEGSLLGRWSGMLMETFVGADYEQGLANLKQLVEATPAPAEAAPATPAAPIDTAAADGFESEAGEEQTAPAGDAPAEAAAPAEEAPAGEAATPPQG